MSLRPWAQRLPSWVLLAIQLCSLPLYLVFGAWNGAAEWFLDWRSERQELRAALRQRKVGRADRAHDSHDAACPCHLCRPEVAAVSGL